MIRVLLLTLCAAPTQDATVRVESGTGEPGLPAVLRLIDGSQRTVQVTGINDAELVTDGAGVPLASLIRADFAIRSTPPASDLIALTSGDHLAAKVSGISDDVVNAVDATGTSFSLPLEFVTAFAFGLPETRSARESRLRALTAAARSDQAILGNDDVITGELTGLTADELLMDTSTGARSIPRDTVATVRLNGELLSEVPREQQVALIRTHRGERITVRKLKWAEADTVTLQTIWNREIIRDASDIASVHFLSLRVRYLSELKPDKIEYLPFADVQRPGRGWAADQNIRGRPFRHESRVFLKGIGMTSQARITWDLDGTFDIFHAQFGIDQSAVNGTAVFSVLLDGQPVVPATPAAHGEPLRDTGAIRLQKAKRLTLSVDYGPRGDIQDVANWIDAVLVRSVDPDPN